MTTSTARHASWESLGSEIVYPGITREIVHGDRQTMVRYRYEPGSVFPVHQHPEEQITVVVQGRIRFEIDGATVELGPGEVAVIPPGVPHGAVVAGNELVETFNAMSPRRSTQPGGANG